jgi:uncharacterized small protein (DUF1192 family)
MNDEERPKPKRDHLVGEPLDTISVEELHDRVNLLQREIARLEAEIQRKNASKSAADALFKS